MMDSDDAWRPAASGAALRGRATLYRQIREFFHERGVMEVATPMLGQYSVTDQHIESIVARQVSEDRYLQTSPEYHMKRLLAAGSGSVYQIAHAFRAGEAGRRHNPEFTLLEWYRLGFDDRALMVEVAELVDLVLGPAAYRTVAYGQLVESVSDVVPNPAWSAAEARDWRLDKALDRLVGERVFVVDYPADEAALARLRDGVAARFELVVDGLEIANGYLELGNAEDLRARFEADAAARASSGKTRYSIDTRFLAAMAAGLPDCAGVAVGLDRLLMLKLGIDDIQEVIAFPEPIA